LVTPTSRRWQLVQFLANPVIGEDDHAAGLNSNNLDVSK
jgi:hypothetical protein